MLCNVNIASASEVACSYHILILKSENNGWIFFMKPPNIQMQL